MLHMHPNVRSLAVVSNYFGLENFQPYHFQPVLLWSDSDERVGWTSTSLASVVPSVEDDPSAAHAELYIPPLCVNRIPDAVPYSLRATDDDVASRPHAVCYLDDNCTAEREVLFNALRGAVGADRVLALGRCDGTAPGFHSNALFTDRAPVHESLSRCRAVVTVEASSRAGHVSARLLAAMIAGAVPLHGGTADTAALFNPDAFVDMFAFRSPAEAASAVAALLADPAALRAIAAQPVSRELDWLNRCVRHDTSVFDSEAAVLRDRLRGAWALS